MQYSQIRIVVFSAGPSSYRSRDHATGSHDHEGPGRKYSAYRQSSVKKSCDLASLRLQPRGAA